MDAVNKYVVGLTGGIGSGKSAAADIFRNFGIDVVDADALSREVVEPGQAALDSIAEHFGKAILSTDGSLDRASLRALVFSNPAERSWLEALLHPLIADLIRLRLEASESPYAVLESPLLFETEQYRLVNRVLVIDTSEETQLARAMRRDGSDEGTIRSIIAAQIPRSERSAQADDVVGNEGSLEQLQNEIGILHKQYLEIATTQ